MQSPGARARSSQEDRLYLPLQVWAPKVPPVPLAVCEAQPVYFARQYKTRVGWRYYFFNFPPALGSELVSSGSSRPSAPTHTHTRLHEIQLVPCQTDLIGRWSLELLHKHSLSLHCYDTNLQHRTSITCLTLYWHTLQQ